MGLLLTSFLLMAKTLTCVAEHVKDVAVIKVKPVGFPLAGSHGIHSIV